MVPKVDESRLEFVKGLAAKGLHVPEIASEMKVSYQAVRDYCNRHKIPVHINSGQTERARGKHGGKRISGKELQEIEAGNKEFVSQAAQEINNVNGIDSRGAVHRLCTPKEALYNGIKLPWTGKVQTMTPNDLTMELYAGLKKYGILAEEVMRMFGFTGAGFVVWLKKWGLFDDAEKVAVIIKEPVGEEYSWERSAPPPDKPSAVVPRCVRCGVLPMVANGLCDSCISVIAGCAKIVAKDATEKVMASIIATPDQVEEFFAEEERRPHASPGKVVLKGDSLTADDFAKIVETFRDVVLSEQARVSLEITVVL